MTPADASPWPVNPVLVELRRGGALESVHRGAWAVLDVDGAVVRGAGDLDHATPSRSAVKCLQALPRRSSTRTGLTGQGDASAGVMADEGSGHEGSLDP